MAKEEGSWALWVFNPYLVPKKAKQNEMNEKDNFNLEN